MGWLCCWKCAYQINALVVVNFLSMAKCHRPRAGSEVVRIDPLHFLAGCHKSRLNQALSVRFNDHFPGEPGLAGVYWSEGWWRWWRQMNYGSYKSCKAPVKYPVFLQAGCPSCRPTSSVKALKTKPGSVCAIS